MIAFKQLIPINRELPEAVYQQVADGIVQLIRKGILPPGSALPGTRSLAADLGVHRKTIVAAYEELDLQSWINIYPRKGVFVAKLLPEFKLRRISTRKLPAQYPLQTGFALDENRIPFSPAF